MDNAIWQEDMDHRANRAEQRVIDARRAAMRYDREFDGWRNSLLWYAVASGLVGGVFLLLLIMTNEF